MLTMCLLRIVKVWIFTAIYTNCYPSFRKRVPNGKVVPNPCRNGGLWMGLGHQHPDGGGELNPFGKDFKEAGLQWTESLCKKDSDGDGVTNGEELGDPKCVWVQGDQDPVFPPGRKVSHPGVCEDIFRNLCKKLNSWFDASKCTKPTTTTETSNANSDPISPIPTTATETSSTKTGPRSTTPTTITETSSTKISPSSPTSTTIMETSSTKPGPSSTTPTTITDTSSTKPGLSGTTPTTITETISSESGPSSTKPGPVNPTQTTTATDTGSIPTSITETTIFVNESQSGSPNTSFLPTSQTVTETTQNNLSTENKASELTTTTLQNETTVTSQLSSTNPQSSVIVGDGTTVNTAKKTSSEPFRTTTVVGGGTTDVTTGDTLTTEKATSTPQTITHSTVTTHKDKCPSDNPVQVNYAKEGSLKNITKPHTVPGVFHPNRVYLEIRHVNTVIFSYLLNDGTTYDDVQHVDMTADWTPVTSSYDGQVQKVFISMQWESSDEMGYRNIDIVGCFQKELASDGNLWSLTAYEQNDEQL